MPQIKSNILHNSGMAIKSRAYLSSLCVFYDQVLLPAETARKAKAIALHKITPIHWRVVTATWTKAPTDEAFDNRISEWEEQNGILLKEGVISRIDSPDKEVIERGKENLANLAKHINRIASLPNPSSDPYYQDWSRWLGQDANSIPGNTMVYMDMYFHQIRGDVNVPGFFSVPPTTHSREAYKQLLAQSTFKYLVPKLSELEPEEILEMRDAVSDYREGFSMHLQKLSASVEQRIDSNDPWGEVSKYAQSIVETELIPDYREFVRILRAKEKGRRGKILDVGGRLLEIEAPFGSPKFFAQVFRAFGYALGRDAEDMEMKFGNRNQAFYFMREIERKA